MNKQDIKNIPPAGIQAEKGSQFQFKIIGQLVYYKEAVKDMLRYDDAVVNGEMIETRQSAKIDDMDLSYYQAEIISNRFTPKRWLSFGFAIVNNEYEII